MVQDLTEENRKLFEELANSDEKGKTLITNKIVSKNIGLVKSIAEKYRKYNSASADDRNDYESEGYFGLLKAVELFDYKLGYKFSTFASHKIEGKIKDFKLKFSNTISIPKEKLQLSNRIKKVRANLEGELNRTVSTDEVWEFFKEEIDHEEFEVAIQSSKLGHSHTLDENPSESLERDFDKDFEDSDNLNKLLNILDARERKIFLMSYPTSDRKTLKNKEIAKKLNLSESSISRIIKDIEIKLRELRKNKSPL